MRKSFPQYDVLRSLVKSPAKGAHLVTSSAAQGLDSLRCAWQPGQGLRQGPQLTSIVAAHRDFPQYDALRSLDKAPVKGPSFREWAQANRDALIAQLNKATPPRGA